MASLQKYLSAIEKETGPVNGKHLDTGARGLNPAPTYIRPP